MAKKDIRLTFFYADEDVWAYVKKNKTRDRLIKWANSFYGRYNFKLDELPISFNETIYKKKFCLAKTNGIKVDYTGDKALHVEILKLEAEQNTISLKMQELDASALPDSEKYTKKMEYYDEIHKLHLEIMKRYKKIILSDDFELGFRSLVYAVNKELKPTKERLPIVFCEFIGGYNVTATSVSKTVGQNFELQKGDGAFFSWNASSFQAAINYSLWGDLYEGPLIAIDIKSMTKKMEYILAHEIVHAAGNTTLDNEGAAKNIMIYADAQGKSPSDVNLEPNDKTKMESAFFVVK